MRMTAIPRKWILGAVAVAATLIIVLWMHQDSPQISYHIYELRWAQQDVLKPHSIPHYFTRGIRWWLQEHRSRREREESARVHRKALVRLGYFERKQFKMSYDLSTGTDADKKFSTMQGRLPLSCTLWQLHVDPTPTNTTVTICVSAADMKVWEKLFAEFDAKEQKIE
ncbi:MAG: hypothetical protein JWM16_1673 [Verrucomicrobiales bacterium]|nr:hypothetical protein [Verrucomicrobiales bacterium]